MSVLKYCAVLVAGAAIGAGVCYIYAKDNLEKKYSAMIKTELDRMAEKSQKSTDISEVEEEDHKVVMNKLTEQVEKTKESMLSSFAQSMSTSQPTTFVRYDKVSDEDRAEMESPKEDPIEMGEPYVIEEYEYDDDTRYEKKELLYFAEDGVLMDPDTEDNLIDIEDDIVGQDWRIMIEDHGAEIVYVRNPKEERDYQIRKEYGLSSNYLP